MTGGDWTPPMSGGEIQSILELGEVMKNKLVVDRLEVANKTVLVRVDFNVPLKDGIVGDDTRIRAALPTIRHLMAQKAKVVLVSHLGRPKGTVAKEFTLGPVAKRLEELLEHKVDFSPECVGVVARDHVNALTPGGVLLLENIRFYPGEEENNPDFAASLADLAEVFVSDAFGTVHRAHASTAGVASHFNQSAAGFCIAKELEFLGQALHNPKSPYVAIVGGAKVGDKIAVLRSMLQRADTLLIGGAMAYTFLKAQGHEIGKSLLDEPNIGLASELMAQATRENKQILLPSDHIVAATIGPDAEASTCGIDIPADMIGLDIGPESVARYKAALADAQMVVWNGPMGMFELPQFQGGSFAIAHALAESNAVSIVGGGDSVAAVNKAGVGDQINHISTGGGASLEFLEGKQLPGIEVLTNVG